MVFIGGQVGAGKTHICTAIVGKLLQNGKSAIYAPWKRIAAELKACLNEPEYTARMDELMKTDCLYIDDFCAQARAKMAKSHRRRREI